MRVRRLRTGAVMAALVVAAPLIVNAAPAPRPAGICDSFLSFLCPKTDPTPDPEDTGAPEDPDTPGEPDSPEEPDTPEEPDSDETDPGSDIRIPDIPTLDDVDKTPLTDDEPVPAPLDAQAPIFTSTPAAMRAGGLSFTGLKGISLVSVPTVDGETVRVLKIDADSITIDGFALTVRPPEEPGLVTTADTMSLQGNVSVYLGSITASALGGEPLTIGIDTPPPLDEIEPGLLDVTMGLVGSTADSISYSNTDQNIVE